MIKALANFVRHPIVSKTFVVLLIGAFLYLQVIAPLSETNTHGSLVRSFDFNKAVNAK